MPTITDVLQVDIRVNAPGAAQTVQGVTNQVQGLGTASGTAATRSGLLTNALGLQNVTMGQAFGAAIGFSGGLAAISAAGDLARATIAGTIGVTTAYNRELSGIRAVSGATAAQTAALSEQLLRVGSAYGIGAVEAAAGAQELIKSGVSIEQALGGATEATMTLARAGGVTLKEAAEISAIALNAFGLSAADMPRVADLLSQAANASAIDLNDLRLSMSQAAAIARTAGIPFEDMARALALLGQNGLRGSDAGTGLRVMLGGLTPNSAAAAKELRSLGIITAEGGNQFFDATGKARGLRDVASILQASLRGLTEQQKLQTLETVFGQDAQRVASILAREGAEGWDRMAGAMNQAGTAAESARIRADNLAGDLEKLKASADATGIAIGQRVDPALRQLTQQMTVAVTAAGQLSQIWGWTDTAAQGLAEVNPAIAAAHPAVRELTAFLFLNTEQGKAWAAQQRQNKAAAQEASAGQRQASIAQTQSVEALVQADYAQIIAQQGVNEETNAALKPARDLRTELEELARGGKDAAASLAILDKATGDARFASDADLDIMAKLRAEVALRNQLEAEGARAKADAFRGKLETAATDPGASEADRASAQAKLDLYNQQEAAQRRILGLERELAQAQAATAAIQREQQETRLRFELAQLPAQRDLLRLRGQSLSVDLEALPLRQSLEDMDREISNAQRENLGLRRQEIEANLALLPARQALQAMEDRINDVVNRRRDLELEGLRIAAQRQAFDAQGALQASNDEVKLRQLEIAAERAARRQGGTLGVDIAANRSVIRDISRTVLPGQELEAFRAQMGVRGVERDQEAERLRVAGAQNALEIGALPLRDQIQAGERNLRGVQDQAERERLERDLRVLGLQQEREAIVAQLEPLDAKQRLLDRETAAIQLRADIDKASFDLEATYTQERLIQSQLRANAIDGEVAKLRERAILLGLGEQLPPEGVPQVTTAEARAADLFGPTAPVQPSAALVNGATGGTANPVALTIQNYGDVVVGSTDAGGAYQQGVQDGAAMATEAFSEALNGAQVPPGGTTPGNRPLVNLMGIWDGS
jgi:TP901 family phage tail tape measure protein